MTPTTTTHGPSLFLSWDELACHDPDHTPYPENWRLTRVLALAHEFDAIRHLCGDHPIPVLSAYRTPEWNRHIGGARHSQHLEGRALDCHPPADMSVQTFFQIIMDRALDPNSAIRGIGHYPEFVHLDVRLEGRLFSWTGSRRMT